MKLVTGRSPEDAWQYVQAPGSPSLAATLASSRDAPPPDTLAGPMSGPPAICSNPNCGWEGEIPNFFVGVKATDVTFQGGSWPCPECGAQASIVSGTYDIDIDGIVRLVRDADLTLAEIARLRSLVREARKSGQTSEDFAAANPELAQIVNLIIQQAPGRDWLMILITVLTLVFTSLQSAHYHAEDEQRQARPTTLVLSDGQIRAIGEAVKAEIEPGIAGKRPRPPRKVRKRPKRPGKTYGQNKRHR